MGRNFMFVSNSIETKNCNKHFFKNNQIQVKIKNIYQTFN